MDKTLNIIEPVICPFSGQIVYDQAGLIKPFPATLIAYEIDQVFTIASKFRIADEIIRLIKDFEDRMRSNSSTILTFQEKCKVNFPWFNWDFFITTNVSSLEFFANHSLVCPASPEDFESSPYGISDIFYFAEVRHHDHILDHLIDMYRFINQTTKNSVVKI